MTRRSFGILRQYLVPQHGLSKLAGWLSSRRFRLWKNWQLRYFIKRYQVALDDALSTDFDDYPDFNSFFTRYLKPGLRPIVSAPDAIASPCDGFVSQMGSIAGDSILQAKGFNFTVTELIGGDSQLAQQFSDGKFATLYLSPKDYHRVHMPVAGVLRQTIFIPGKLFSVNHATARAIPRLFARNERLVCIFDTELGAMAVILVGAMLVGSIKTVWSGPPHGKKVVQQSYPVGQIKLDRGEELGHFIMGSTVILIFQDKKLMWAPDLQSLSPVLMGQAIAKALLP
jgi:phosphatidylserine decarboxylase